MQSDLDLHFPLLYPYFWSYKPNGMPLTFTCYQTTIFLTASNSKLLQRTNQVHVCITEMMISVFHIQEHIVRKGENAG